MNWTCSVAYSPLYGYCDNSSLHTEIKMVEFSWFQEKGMKRSAKHFNERENMVRGVLILK